MKRFLTLCASAFLATQLEAQVLLQDDFTYADGPTTDVSAGKWSSHSGTAGSSFVAGGKLQVFGSRSEDINASLGTTNESGTVYASFVVNCTTVPNAGGAYFAHFKDSGTSNFRGRTWALAPAGTAARSLAAGITAAGSPPTAAVSVFPLDLATNVNYRVVIAYDGVNFLGTLWVDPVSTVDQNVPTFDVTTTLGLSTFAFRQATGGGSLLVDDLYVANTFEEVNLGAVKAATVHYQPLAAITVDNFASTNFGCVAGGAGTVTFQWQKQSGPRLWTFSMPAASRARPPANSQSPVRVRRSMREFIAAWLPAPPTESSRVRRSPTK